MEHILKLEQVKKYYGGAAGNITKAVDGISMEVNKGEFVGLLIDENNQADQTESRIAAWTEELKKSL